MDDSTATIRGVTLGRAPYVWTAEPVALLSTPTIRSEDRDRPNRDGVIPGGDFMGGKLLTFEVAILGSTATETEQLASDLAAAFAPSRTNMSLDVRATGTPSEYRMVGRPRGAEVSLGRPNELFGNSVAYAQCRFFATDPVRYSVTDSTLSLGMDSVGVGLEYPVEYPVVYGGSGGSGQGSAENAGSASVDWFATFTGPLINPRLEHVDTGRYVSVVGSITAAQTVVMDGTRGAVLLNGTTPRPSWIGPGSSWFQLQPGSNLLRFTADAGSGGCIVVWRSGWS